MLRRVAPCLLFCLITGACGADEPGRAIATTTTVGPTTSTTVARGNWKTPLEAANNLMAAWKNSDGQAAARSANQVAVEAMFGRSYVPYQSRGCDAPNQLGSDCNYRLTGAGGVRLHLVADPAAGFLVDKVTFID